MHCPQQELVDEYWKTLNKSKEPAKGKGKGGGKVGSRKPVKKEAVAVKKGVVKKEAVEKPKVCINLRARFVELSHSVSILINAGYFLIVNIEPVGFVHL